MKNIEIVSPSPYIYVLNQTHRWTPIRAVILTAPCFLKHQFSHSVLPQFIFTEQKGN